MACPSRRQRLSARRRCTCRSRTIKRRSFRPRRLHHRRCLRPRLRPRPPLRPLRHPLLRQRQPIRTQFCYQVGEMKTLPKKFEKAGANRLKPHRYKQAGVINKSQLLLRHHRQCRHRLRQNRLKWLPRPPLRSPIRLLPLLSRCSNLSLPVVSSLLCRWLLSRKLMIPHRALNRAFQPPERWRLPHRLDIRPCPLSRSHRQRPHRHRPRSTFRRNNRPLLRPPRHPLQRRRKSIFPHSNRRLRPPRLHPRPLKHKLTSRRKHRLRPRNQRKRRPRINRLLPKLHRHRHPQHHHHSQHRLRSLAARMLLTG